jgi:hypothetical protein
VRERESLVPILLQNCILLQCADCTESNDIDICQDMLCWRTGTQCWTTKTTFLHGGSKFGVWGCNVSGFKSWTPTWILACIANMQNVCMIQLGGESVCPTRHFIPPCSSSAAIGLRFLSPRPFWTSNLL